MIKPILLRCHEAAELCNVAEKTWRTWNQLGKIPKPLQIGRLHFWRYEELIRWIAEGCPSRKIWNDRDLKNAKKPSEAGAPGSGKVVKVSKGERKPNRKTPK